jgi:proteasome accessory factor A
VADTVDWVAKLRIIDGFTERHDLPMTDPRVRAIDLQYHDMRPDRCLATRAGLRALVDDSAAVGAMTAPPDSTRAYFRGRCVTAWPDRIVSANWDGIVVDTPDGLVRIPMMDPTKGTKTHVKSVLDGSASIDDLLTALTGSVERMEPDPGW